MASISSRSPSLSQVDTNCRPGLQSCFLGRVIIATNGVSIGVSGTLCLLVNKLLKVMA